MRVLAKTFGWLLISGLIIFISNLSAGIDWKVAIVGAAVAKIGTTIAYLFYEVGFEKAWKRQPKATTVTATTVTATTASATTASATPCPCPA